LQGCQQRLDQEFEGWWERFGRETYDETKTQISAMLTSIDNIMARYSHNMTTGLAEVLTAEFGEVRASRVLSNNEKRIARLSKYIGKSVRKYLPPEPARAPQSLVIPPGSTVINISSRDNSPIPGHAGNDGLDDEWGDMKMDGDSEGGNEEHAGGMEREQHGGCGQSPPRQGVAPRPPTVRIFLASLFASLLLFPSCSFPPGVFLNCLFTFILLAPITFVVKPCPRRHLHHLNPFPPTPTKLQEP
jgi:hypothetical protein